MYAKKSKIILIYFISYEAQHLNIPTIKKTIPIFLKMNLYLGHYTFSFACMF